MEACHRVPHALRSLQEIRVKQDYRCPGTTSLQLAAHRGDNPMVEVLTRVFLENDQRDFVQAADCDGYMAEDLARSDHFEDTADLIYRLTGGPKNLAVERKPVKLFPPARSFKQSGAVGQSSGGCVKPTFAYGST